MVLDLLVSYHLVMCYQKTDVKAIMKTFTLHHILELTTEENFYSNLEHSMLGIHSIILVLNKINLLSIL